MLFSLESQMLEERSREGGHDMPYRSLYLRYAIMTLEQVSIHEQGNRWFTLEIEKKKLELTEMEEKSTEC